MKDFNMNNISLVKDYKIKVTLTAIVLLFCFISIYYLQNQMWKYQTKYIGSSKQILKLEETLTESTVRNIELQGKIELLEQQPVKEIDKW